jgi:Protein of unknown function (DUF3313)
MLRACMLAAPFLLGACASLKPTQSGFLTDYDRLQTTTHHPSEPSYRYSGLDIKRYSAFLLEPVTFHPADPNKHLDQAAIDELTADYREKLRTTFARHLSETTQPGPNVMRIRASITDVGKSNATMNAITMLVVLLPFTAGGASTEAEVVDSISGERLAALQGVNNGGRDFLGGPIGYLTQYGHAHRAFTKQADELCDQIFTERM